MAPSRAFRRRFFRVFFMLLLVLAAVSLIWWQDTLAFLGRFLMDYETPQKADLILVLAGDFYGPRVLEAAYLGTHNYAPRVLISGTPYQNGLEGEYAIAFLTKQGYPPDLFESFGHNSHSTIEEAIALRGELARRKVKRVILVTSGYHSRRAAIVFGLFCPGVHFISVPSAETNYHPDRWWTDEKSKQLFWSEWTKILGTVFMAYPMDLLRRVLGK